MGAGIVRREVLKHVEGVFQPLDGVLVVACTPHTKGHSIACTPNTEATQLPNSLYITSLPRTNLTHPT